MSTSISNPVISENGNSEESMGTMIRIKVYHATNQYEVAVPAQSTFGELKGVLAQEIGLEPHKQRMLFRGKEKDNDECLHIAGVKDMAKVVVLEDPASRDQKIEQIKKDQGIARSCEAIALVRAEVDKLSEKVSALESAVLGGKKVEEKEFIVLTELLMVQLLKLDGIEVEGEGKVHRRTEVHRIQSTMEKLDMLKARNANPFSNSSKAISITTEWEAFESPLGSQSAPHQTSPSTKITDDWELFN
ncbi:BAG family molecular chaperone regulator 4-like [Typha latifolia]|uniref:BAG family molecular chaperone regulator 4-like n=1 Tax=Typha latifolia TaxID=4733 RepID=UPI003C2B3528